MPGQWEHLQPVDLYRVWDAQRWRRGQDLDVVAKALWYIRAMITKDPPVKQLRKAMANWPTAEECLNG